MTEADIGAKGAGIGKMHAGPSNRKATTPAQAALWRWWPGSRRMAGVPGNAAGVRVLSPRRRDRSAMTATARNGAAPHRRLVPAVRTACLLLALACLAFPSPLAAQTSDPILVSNQTKTVRNNPYVGDSSYAQQFRTGSASGVYAISDVILTFSKAADRGTTTVTVRSDSSGNPADAALATMTLDSAGMGNIAFTPSSPVRLEPQTRYWVVAEHSTGGTSGPRWARVHIADGLDTDSAAGWEIDQTYQERRAGGWTAPSDAQVQAMKIRLRGTVVPAVTIASDGDVTEGTAASFTLTRSGDTADALEVGVTVSETGDMVASGDEGTKTATFAAGSATATVTVPTQADSASEPDSTVTVAVAAGDGYVAGTPSETGVVVADDDDPLVTVTAAGNVTEGAAVRFNLSRTGSTAAALTVRVMVSETGDMVASGDEGTKTVRFSANTALFQLAVPTQADSVDEADSEVTVTVLDGSDYDPGTPSETGVVVADDDDPVVTVAAGGGVTEGAPARFTLTRTGYLAVTLAVEVTVSETGDMVAAGDEGTRTVTFGANSATAMVDVPTEADSVDEDDSTVTVAVVDGSDYDPGAPSEAEVVASDDDQAALAIDSPQAEEGDAGETSTLTFTVTLAPVSDRQVTVRYADSGGGTAASGTDYEAVAGGTLTFAPGDSTKTIAVTVTGDDAFEDDETVVIRLSGATGGATIGTAAGTGTIVDDEVPGLSIDSPQVNEGDTGFANLVFTVTLEPASDSEVSVWYADFENGSATRGTDYLSVSAAELTFAPGETEKTITVRVRGDRTDEEDETVELGLGTPTGAEISQGTGVGTIRNDDEATLAIDSPRAEEGDAGETSTLTFTVTLDPVSEQRVTVAYADSGGGTATSGTDYAAVAGGTLTFAPGDSTKTVTVTVTGDDVGEGNETVGIALSGATGGATIGTAVGTGTIIDNDVPQFSIDSPRVDEGDSGTADLTFTVTLDPASTGRVTVAYADSGGGTATSGTDYAAVAGGTLTFAPGDVTKTVTVTVRGDGIDEPDETVEIALSGATGGADVATPAGTGTIGDDDAEPTVTLVLTPDSITEVDEESTVTATLNHPSSEATTVTVTVAPVAPAVAGDYRLSGNRELTIPAGETTSTGTVTVTSVNNTVDAPHKTVTVSATATNSQGVTAPEDVTLTIRDDDDEPRVTLVLTPASITEDRGVSTVTATLDHPSSVETTVTVTVAPVAPTGSGDYTVSGNRELTIAADSTTSTGTVTITAVDNAVDTADRAVTVSGTATNSQGVTDPEDVTLTLTNDDQAIIELSVALGTTAEGDGETAARRSGPATSGRGLTVAGTAATSGEEERVSEGAGETTVTVTATVTGPTPLGEERTVTVSVTGSGQDGAVGFKTTKDGVTFENFPIVVPPGGAGTSAMESFVLVPEDDEVDESPATVRVSGRVAGVTIVTPTSLTLVDDDEAPTGIELCLTLGPGAEGDCETEVTVSEGDDETPVTVRATVTGDTRFGTAQEIAVSVAGSDRSEEVVGVAEVADFTVTIPAGEASGTGMFTVRPDDDKGKERNERDETLRVSGRLEGVAITPEELTVTVTDDDVVVVDVKDAEEVREGEGPAVFEVTLSYPSVHTITLTATSQDGTATQGEDYEPIERVMEFAPGDTKQALRVAVQEDKLIEETETFTVRVSDPSAGAMIGKGEATGTILDAETLTQRQRRLQYALAAFGRTVVQDLVMALEARQRAGAGGSTVTLGGTPVPSGAVSFEEVVGLVRRHVGPDGTLPTIRDFLARSHFQLALGEGGADEAGLGSWVLWGRGSYSRFAGQLDPTVATEGNVFAGQLGLEWRRQADLVAGVLVNGSEGAVELTADVETEVEPRLVSLHPYVQWSPWAGLRTWGMLGYGWGEATVTDTSLLPTGDTDLAMMMAAGGGSHTLASLGGLDWSLGTNGFFVEMETEAQEGRLAAVEAEAWQLRLLLEGRGGLAVGGAGLSGTVGLAARVDGGDAERGLGLELGSGVTYGHPGLGLDVTVNGRVLLTHEATGFEDAGVSLAVGFDPGERGQGLYLALTPAWGNATSGVRALWADRQPLAAGPQPARVPSALRLDAEVGYTVPWRRGGSTLTAYGAVAGDGRTTRQYRVGQRLAWTPSLALSLEADRRERDGGLPEHILWLTGSLRY